MYKSEDIEDWNCFQMDCEGHLVSLKSQNFQLSNESIEHLSNFPHLRNLHIVFKHDNEEPVTNFSILSNLRRLSVTIGKEIQDPELFQDLGLFSNLLYLHCYSNQPGILLNLEQLILSLIYRRL